MRLQRVETLATDHDRPVTAVARGAQFTTKASMAITIPRRSFVRYASAASAATLEECRTLREIHSTPIRRTIAMGCVHNRANTPGRAPFVSFRTSTLECNRGWQLRLAVAARSASVALATRFETWDAPQRAVSTTAGVSVIMHVLSKNEGIPSTNSCDYALAMSPLAHRVAQPRPVRKTSPTFSFLSRRGKSRHYSPNAMLSRHDVKWHAMCEDAVCPRATMPGFQLRTLGPSNADEVTSP